MKAMAIVAHPDDCIIFAYSFIHAHPTLDWTICYLTYTEQDSRGKELAEFWAKRNIKTRFLGYVDDYHDIENEKISFDEKKAYMDIQYLIFNQDLILTHDENGDYGHIHHKFVNSATATHKKRITFAGLGKGTKRFTIPEGTYSLDELPEHRTVIADFFPNKHSNEYLIPDNVRALLYPGEEIK